MKIIFLSDIHSNWDYLSQFYTFIEKEEVDYIYFLGDAIGYYDEPNKVIEWLRRINAICIKGNHEKYLLNELQFDNKLNSIYRVEENRNVISDENIGFIKMWKDSIEVSFSGKKFFILHGDIYSSENHIYNVNDIDKNLLKKYDFYVYGHTHIPLIQYSYGCCIINPGSIGQPRDYTTLPSYAVVDLNTQEVVIKKINIKKDTYLKKLENNNFDKKIIEILKRDKNESN